MVVEEGHVGRGDDAASEPAAVEGVDRCHCRRDGRTLDVHVTVGGGFVDVHVENSAVLVALLDHVVPDLDVPRRIRFAEMIEPTPPGEFPVSAGRATRLPNTYVAGSNMFANIKHCVAIGGAGCTACGKAFAKFRAFAAAGGICIPVPEVTHI